MRNAKDMEPQLVCEVLLCTVRVLRESLLKDAEGGQVQLQSITSFGKSGKKDKEKGEIHPPFSFELVSPNRRTYTLQATSRPDLDGWTSAIRYCCENMLVGGGHSATSGGGYAGGVGGGGGGGGAGESKAGGGGGGGMMSGGMQGVLAQSSECADCGTPGANWAVINLGIVVCISCSGVHRSLGVHISKVRVARCATRYALCVGVCVSISISILGCFFIITYLIKYLICSVSGGVCKNDPSHPHYPHNAHQCMPIHTSTESPLFTLYIILFHSSIPWYQLVFIFRRCALLHWTVGTQPSLK